MEAAMLGIPSIRFSDFAGKISVLEELEHVYKLTFGITPDEPQNLLNLIKDLLSNPNLSSEFQTRRQAMLSKKIDVTAFLVWFIENYPKSVSVMKEDQAFQYTFR
jgi:predicted glycosyltransferase